MHVCCQELQEGKPGNGKTKARGFSWRQRIAARMAQLPLTDKDEVIWTRRSEVQLNGLVAQQQYWCFLHTLVDYRFASVMKNRGLSLTDPAPKDVVTDCSKNIKFQKRNGGATMLGNSSL